MKKSIFTPNPNEIFHEHLGEKSSIPEVEQPEGFRDDSWINDACPSMVNESLDLKIWVDYDHPEHRERSEAKQFALTRNSISEDNAILETDNYDEILSKVEEIRKQKNK